MRRLVLAVEAMSLLIAASAARRALPLRLLDRFLGVRADPATPMPAAADAAVATDVRWALAAARRRLPWHVGCVPDALAGSVMLRRRGLPYRVTIGVAADEAFEAHAWLEAGDVVVTGARGAARFTALSAYDGAGAR